MALSSPPRLVLALLAFVTSPAAAQEGGEFLLQIGDVEAVKLKEVVVPVLADAPVAYQGFSFSVLYPPAELKLERIGVERTIIEAISADFVSSTIFPEEGIFIMGVLVETEPPFDFNLVPTIGFPLAVAQAYGRVLRDTTGEITLSFASGAEPRAVPNIFAVDNYSVPATRLIPGRVRVVEPPRIPLYIRGDANLDARVDISDFISVLSWIFMGHPEPRCEDAADANSDDWIDLTDGIFLLSYFYLGGDPPALPGPAPGPNPALQKKLKCAVPLSWLPLR